MTSESRSLTAGTRWAVATAFVACWVLGLVVAGPDLGTEASPSGVGQAFSGHHRAVASSVLVHGAAGILLVLLGLALGSGLTRRTTVALASIAAVLSIDQLAGEVALALDPHRAGGVALWEMLSRVDGAKMLVLAALVASVWRGAVHRGHTLTVVSCLAVVSLVLSGVGCLTLSAGLTAAAAASLPLVLVWSLTATAASTGEQTTDVEPHLLADGYARR